jgi:hypothetical protein
MVDNGRDEAWRAYLRKYGMAAVQPQLLPDGSRYPPPFEWHGPPRSYVVRYEGLGRDEAEFDFELDAPRHRQDGYVVSHREWREHRGFGAVRRWLTWPFKVRYWGPLFAQPPRHPVSTFARPGVLVVTYTRDDERYESPSGEAG